MINTKRRLAEVVDLRQLKRPDIVHPGAAIALVAEEEYSIEFVGVDSMVSQKGIDKNTLFRVGSLSKMFLGVLISQMADAGVLSLDDSCGKYLTVCNDILRSASIRDLLNMSSGLRDEFGLVSLTFGSLIPPLSVAEKIALILSQETSNFQPGQGTLYCNSGFSIIHLIVEQILGKPLDKILQEHLFSKAGMHDTYHEADPHPIGMKLATPYAKLPSGDYKVSESYIERSGSGGIISTIDDMVKWHYFVSNELDWFHSPMTRTGASSSSGDAIARYALGMLHVNREGVEYIEHGSGIKGWTGYYMYDLGQKAAAIILANTNSLHLPSICLNMVQGQSLPKSVLPRRPQASNGANGVMVDRKAKRAYYISVKEGRLSIDNRAFYGCAKEGFFREDVGGEEGVVELRSDNDVRKGLLYTVFGKTHRLDWISKMGSLSFKELKEYEGFYRSSDLPNGVLLESEDNQLVAWIGAEFQAGPAVRLRPLGCDMFISVEGDFFTTLTVYFVRGAHGFTESLELSFERMNSFPMRKVSSEYKEPPRYRRLATILRDVI